MGIPFLFQRDRCNECLIATRTDTDGSYETTVSRGRYRVTRVRHAVGARHHTTYSRRINPDTSTQLREYRLTSSIYGLSFRPDEFAILRRQRTSVCFVLEDHAFKQRLDDLLFFWCELGDGFELQAEIAIGDALLSVVLVGGSLYLVGQIVIWFCWLGNETRNQIK